MGEALYSAVFAPLFFPMELAPLRAVSDGLRVPPHPSKIPLLGDSCALAKASTQETPAAWHPPVTDPSQATRPPDHLGSVVA